MGASLAQDFTGHATAATNILARTIHKKEEILLLLKERANIDFKSRTLRVIKK